MQAFSRGRNIAKSFKDAVVWIDCEMTGLNH